MAQGESTQDLDAVLELTPLSDAAYRALTCRLFADGEVLSWRDVA
jgi:hypothetical protein